MRRCWTLRGHRVVVPHQTKYEWSYAYSAADLVRGAVEFVCLPTASLQMSYLFLEQLVATEAEAIHVVIWDKAGFHLDDEHHQLPEQIRLLPLPAYCPELNPMERLPMRFGRPLMPLRRKRQECCALSGSQPNGYVPSSETIG